MAKPGQFDNLSDSDMKTMFDEAVVRNSDELKMSAEEVKKFGEAMKKPEFGDLLREYMNEISDPSHRAEQEQYLRELEAENKVPGNIKLVRPVAGFCVKTKFTKGGEGKCFVNVCMTDEIGRPTFETKELPADVAGGEPRRGQAWSFPFSLGPRRMENDKKGVPAPTFDIAFHPDAIARAKAEVRFQRMLVETALENVEARSTEVMGTEVKLERTYHVVKGKTCMGGTPATMTTRVSNEGATTKGSKKKSAASKSGGGGGKRPTDSKALHERVKRTVEAQAAASSATVSTEPEHTIVHRGVLDLGDFVMGGPNSSSAPPSKRPKELVVRIKLPKLSSARGVKLDVSESALKLDYDEKPELAEYHLDLALPYPVLDEKGSAKWDKKQRMLVVTLPVRKPELPKPVLEAAAEDAAAAVKAEPPLVEEVAAAQAETAAAAEAEPALVEEVAGKAEEAAQSAVADGDGAAGSPCAAALEGHVRWVSPDGAAEMDPLIAAALAASKQPLPIPAEERAEAEAEARAQAEAQAAAAAAAAATEAS